MDNEIDKNAMSINLSNYLKNIIKKLHTHGQRNILFAKEHIERWINAWNNKDLETVLSMFTEDIEFSSPKINLITPEFNSEKVNNKQDLKHYWSTAKEKITSLHFTSKEYYVKGNTCVLEYISTFDGKTKFLSIEKFEFNEDNKIYKACAFYGPQIE